MAKNRGDKIAKLGRMIEPVDVVSQSSVKDFIDNVFRASGFNARRLGEACEVYTRMLDSNATVALTLAGAMTPIGMSGPIIDLMKRGFIDFIVSTGANLYHDFHRAFNYPVIQGDAFVDDGELHKRGIARIYDTYIWDDETLLPTDAAIVEAGLRNKVKEPVSTAKLHKLLGEFVLESAPFPEKSFVAQAAALDVPIFVASPGDSSIAMNMVVPKLFGKGILIDPVQDVIETTAIVREAEKNGVIMIGGGAPKNFYMQTQPTLWQILRDDIGGHDYFIQLTTDSPHWGGLSGATPQEAHSWGKVKKMPLNQAVVYSCASISFPLLAKYAIEAAEPRDLKRIYASLEAKTRRLTKRVKSNQEFMRNFKKIEMNMKAADKKAAKKKK